jgi:hypothetical protein
MNTEVPMSSSEIAHPLLVLPEESPVIIALEKSILSLLEDTSGLCTDDEQDRQALAAILAPVILIEIFGFTEWGSVSTP